MDGIRKDRLARAQGCLLGQLAGDALGSRVEFMTPREIRDVHPAGVRDLQGPGVWNTLPGQPTDDSEMALMLARSLVREGRFVPEVVLAAYRDWLRSEPFDCGSTTSKGLRGDPDPDSQANGALMRVSPLGIFGAGRPGAELADWARQDAALTHPNPVCLQANVLYVLMIAQAIDAPTDPRSLYTATLERAESIGAPPPLAGVVRQAAVAPPANYVEHQGWVLIALHNAIWQLLHAPNPEEGVIDTVARGGDTDTNAAICGALLGAVYGREAIPSRWVEAILQCRPRAGDPGVHKPRPETFWTIDALELAEALLERGTG